MSEEKKEIEVITGDGKNLNISPVYEHIKLDDEPTDDKKKKHIVIHKNANSKKNKSKKD